MQRISRYSSIVKKGIEQGIIPQPSPIITERVVMIYKPCKSAMQSGMENTRHWKLKFNTSEKFENPLIGWTSSTDPLQAMRIKFEDQESAIQFCIKNGWKYTVEAPKEREWKMKAYADNFKYSDGPLRQIKTK